MTSRNHRARSLAVWALVLAVALGWTRSPAAEEDPTTCLARTVYFEARDDGQAGMAAVAAVVMNRVRHPDFPDDVCAVVREGGETPPCQFTWWCDGKSDEADDQELWALALDVARQALSGEAADPTGAALFFHHREVEAPYHEERELVAEIGSHLFYR